MGRAPARAVPCRRGAGFSATRTASGAPLESASADREPINGTGAPGASTEDGAGRQADFGYQRVDESKKKSMVEEVFTGVASEYDIMNDFMSAGVHRVWKRQFVSELQPTNSTKMLDVAGGTGDIAFRAIDYVRRYEREVDGKTVDVTVCDYNGAMLEEGKKKAVELGYLDRDGEPLVQFVQGDAEKLPFEDNTFDAYTIAFGLRNVTHIDAALAEAHRVLRPGGRFMCLEFSRVENPILGPLYDFYSFNVIPEMGEVVARNRQAYQYLVESIRKFPPQQHLKSMMLRQGFRNVEFENLTMGVVAIHSGYKSADPKQS